MSHKSALSNKVALVTGSAKRIGAASARALHAAGAQLVIHHNQSEQEALQLVAELNAARKNSAIAVQAKLGSQASAQFCIEQTVAHWQRLDIVVNNASSFYPTPIAEVSESAVEDLMSSNFLAPLFLTQAAHSELNRQRGCVINMVDIHGLAPYKNHAVYCAAKAALVMLTKSMALELAPNVRVNAIAPGAILWPQDEAMTDNQIMEKLANIPLAAQGTPDDIAQLVVYLCSDTAKFITGEIIKVDGGSSI